MFFLKKQWSKKQDIKKFIQKIKTFFNGYTYKKEVVHLWRESKERLVFGFSALVIISALCIVGNISGCRLGYEVIIDGENMGNITKKAVVYDAIAEVGKDIKTYVDANQEYKKNPVFVRRLVFAKSLATEDSLKAHLMSHLEYMVDCYGIYSGDKAILGLLDEKSAKEVLEQYKASFKPEQMTDDTVIEFYKPVKIKKEYLSLAMLESKDEAIKYLKSNPNILPVKCTQTLELEEAVPFETKQIKDGNLYEDTTKIKTEGADGVAKVVATIVSVNGVEKSKKILSTATVKNPTTQVEIVGTKELPPTTGTGSFIRPAMGVMTSRYGTRNGSRHNGIDIGGQLGSDVLAADGGIVTFAGVEDGYGNYVVINHENGYQTCYGHCDTLKVKVGDRVYKNQPIATLGNTGRSTGPHLHFEVKYNGQFVDPQSYVNY